MVAIRRIALPELDVDFHLRRPFTPVIQQRVRAAFQSCVATEILVDDFFEKAEDADQVGFARAVATNEHIQRSK